MSVPMGLWTKHPLYPTWKNIRRKGQDGWPTFKEFEQDVGKKPQGCVLTRKDPSLPFGPENWIWKPLRGMASSCLTHDGQTRSISDWSRMLSIPRSTIRSRLASGWSPAEALSKPRQPRSGKEYWLTANGEVKGTKIENKVIAKRGSLAVIWEYLLECIKACNTSKAKCTFKLMRSDGKATIEVCEVSC